MYNALKVGLALAGASAMAVGGTAFTAANTGLVAGKVGYQEVATTGVAIVSTTYTPLASDASKLDTIVFTTAQDIDTNFTAKLTLNQGGTPVVKACTITGSSNPWTITCDGGSTLGVNVADVASVGLTVTENEPA